QGKGHGARCQGSHETGLLCLSNANEAGSPLCYWSRPNLPRKGDTSAYPEEVPRAELNWIKPLCNGPTSKAGYLPSSRKHTDADSSWSSRRAYLAEFTKSFTHCRWGTVIHNSDQAL